MSDLTIKLGITERGFTYADFTDRTGKVVFRVQCSSAINYDGTAAGCLRGCDGAEWPGTSALWLHVTHPGNTEEKAGVSLKRTEVAELVALLSRWLATGFVEGAGKLRGIFGDKE